MDRLTPEGSTAQIKRQIVGVILLILMLTGILGYKVYDEGWLLPRTPLVLPEEPTLLFFNRHKGCECVLLVYRSANKQIQNWTDTERNDVPVISIDLDRRPDLGMQYDIFRVPALLLLDEYGKVFYLQEESVSDSQPLDLATFELKIQEVIHGQ